jgi:acyl-CoA dehydrogenase
MDFTLSPEIEDLRVRTRAFVDEHVLPLESDPHNFSDHENIPHDRLEPVREKGKESRAVGAAIAQGIRRHGRCRSSPGP